MKRIFALLTGIVAVLTFGLSFGAETMPPADDATDKTIRDDDLLKFNLDQDRGTINQLPALPGSDITGAGGSAAGGIRNDSNTAPSDKDNSKKAVEQNKGEGSSDTGVMPAVPDRYGY